MKLLVGILITNLVTVAYCDAPYPAPFFLKGPTSQATIYGVDGSKIISVADAGSISSAGVKGATFSSYTATQNLGGAGSDKITSPDCNCSQSGSGVVLQGPSMSATIVGPSVDAGGSQNKNYNGPDNQGHYGSNHIGAPGLGSVNIQGPSAWGTNVGPSYTSHSSLSGSNKGNQQPDATNAVPCGPNSKNCGVNSLGGAYSSGTPKSDGRGDNTALPSIPSVNIQGPSAWGANVGPSFTSHSSYSGSNRGNQQPDATNTEPCGSDAKNCRANTLGGNTVPPSLPSVNIQGPSLWGTNVGPNFTSHNSLSASNQGNQQPDATNTQSCGLNSKSCSGKTQKSGTIVDNTAQPNLPTANIKGPSAWGTNAGPSYTSHNNLGGSHPTSATSKFEGTLENTALPNQAIVNIQGPSSWGTNIGPSYKSHSNFDGSSKGNQQSHTTNIEPCGSNSKNCDVNSSGDTYSSETPKSDGRGDNTAIPSLPSVNIQGPSAWGTNVGPSYTSHNKLGGSNKGNSLPDATINSINVDHPNETPKSEGTGGQSSSLPSLSSVQSVWGTKVGPTYTSHGNFAGSNKKNLQLCDKSSKNCNINAGDLSSESYNKNTQSSFNLLATPMKTHGQNALNINIHQSKANGHGYPKLSSSPSWIEQGSIKSSGIQEPNHHLGYNGGQGGYYTSSSYTSPVYTKPTETVSTSWFANKNLVIPESSIGFNKQNNAYAPLNSQRDNLESSSLAPPTYVMPNNGPRLVNGDQGLFNINRGNIFGFAKDGKGAQDFKYDCYVIQLPTNSYAYVLPSGESSELLKKIAQSSFVHPDFHHHHHHHNHPH